MCAKRYQIICETEQKTLVEKGSLAIAKHLAFKHSLRSHTVVVKDDKGNEFRYGNGNWIFKCNKCGSLFNDDMAWVIHLTGQKCTKTAE